MSFQSCRKYLFSTKLACCSQIRPDFSFSFCDCIQNWRILVNCASVYITSSLLCVIFIAVIASSRSLRRRSLMGLMSSLSSSSSSSSILRYLPLVCEFLFSSSSSFRFSGTVVHWSFVLCGFLYSICVPVYCFRVSGRRLRILG